MVDLIQLTQPLECPDCLTSGRQGYLRKVMKLDEAEHILQHTIDYECGTCFALYEVKKDEL
jgi:DNA-directed RNA polymerase subunit RPC12/RpoP